MGFYKTQVIRHWPTHTYSQKYACQDDGKKIQKNSPRITTLAKSLIFHGLPICFTTSHFVENRMNSALWLVKPQLRTKLSTEFVDSEKMSFAPGI